MANTKNLVKNEDLTPSQRRKNASKAGKASVEAKRKRRALKEELELILEMKAEDNRTYQENISVALVKEAQRGNTKAFEIIRDTIGEKPKEKIEHSGNVNNPFTELSTEELRQLIKDE